MPVYVSILNNNNTYAVTKSIPTFLIFVDLEIWNVKNNNCAFILYF